MNEPAFIPIRPTPGEAPTSDPECHAGIVEGRRGRRGLPTGVLRRLLLVACCLALSACEKEVQNAPKQSRDKTLAASRFSTGEVSARPPLEMNPDHSEPPATASLARTASETARPNPGGLDARAMPYRMTREILKQGRERFAIFCQPCHSPVGDGDGLIVRRGFPAPPSFHAEQLRRASDRHFFDFITQGHGAMYSYAERMEPTERWAIVAYIRALQLSQGAHAADLPEKLRQTLATALERAR